MYKLKLVRVKKIKKLKSKALSKCPHKKGSCLKIFVTSPKKPNSAERKVVKLVLTNKKMVIAHIPGENHNLQKHSTVLVRGGNTRDLPGVKYKIVRGKYDLTGVYSRRNGRSKYGTRRPAKIS